MSAFSVKVISPLLAQMQAPQGELASNLMALAAFVVAISGLYAKVADGVKLRGEIRALKTMIADMLEALREDRAIIDEAHAKHGIPLPERYKKRSFDKSIADDTAEHPQIHEDPSVGT